MQKRLNEDDKLFIKKNRHLSCQNLAAIIGVTKNTIYVFTRKKTKKYLR